MRRRREPAARPRRGPGPQGRRRRDQEDALAWPSRPRRTSAADGKLDLDDAVFGERFHMAARPRGRARRAARAPPRHRLHADARRGRDDRRQGLAPEGHRPRPRRRAVRAPHWTGGGVAFGPKPRGYTVKVNRKARRGAARRAVACTPSAARIAVDRRRRRSRRPRPRRRPSALGDFGEGRRAARARRRRRGDLRASRSATSAASAVLPGRRRRRRRRDRRRAPGASREAALEQLGGLAGDREAGRRRVVNARQRDHPAGRLREELRPDRGRTSTRSASTRTRTRRRSARRSRRSSTCGSTDVRTMQRQAQAEAPRLDLGPHARAGRRRSCELAPGRAHRAVRGRSERASNEPMAIKKHKPTSPGRRFATWLDARRGHARRAREVARRRASRRPAGATRTGASRAATAAAAPSASTARSTSSAARTACRRRSPRSSTTRTAAPTSRCSTTRDGEKRYILAPQRLAVGVHGGVRAKAPTSRSATAFRSQRSRPAPSSTTSSSRPAAAASSAAPPAPRSSSSPRRASYATLRLPSGEMRMVAVDCRATIGTIGNADHENVTIGKAGRNRHKGKRPQTRGTAMNPVDHPHGGGEGKTTAGPPPGHAVGRADARLPHAQEAQGSPTATSCAAAGAGRRGSAECQMLDQEGPVGRGAPDEAHRAR